MFIRTIVLLSSSILLFNSLVIGQNHKVIESNQNYMIVEFDFDGEFTIVDTIIQNTKFSKINGSLFAFREPGEPWVPSYHVLVGVPFNSQPKIDVLNVQTDVINNKLIMPFPDDSSYYYDFNLDILNKDIYFSNKYFPALYAKVHEPYVVRYSRIAPVEINPFQFNPVQRELIFYKKIRLKFTFNPQQSNIFHTPVKDNYTDSFIKESVINYETAKNWIGKSNSTQSSASSKKYWYDPGKNWYKIYVNEKKLYSITYEEMINYGLPVSGGIPSKNFQIYNNEKAIPIEVVDGGDNIFNAGDYIRFVGDKAPPSPYCSQNIYNTTGIYWLTYQADTSDILRFTKVNGFPQNYQVTYKTNYRTVHYEVDSIYEKLGYAPDDKRDYWFWGGATGNNGVPGTRFVGKFPTFTEFELTYPVKLKVNLHGITDYNCNNGTLFGHNANIFVNDKYIGTAKWDGQKEYTFESYFTVGDSIGIFPDNNTVAVLADGNICHSSKSDVIRINWFELSYVQNNRVTGNYYSFSSNIQTSTRARFWLWNWDRDNIQIYAPSSNKQFINAEFFNDIYKSVLFMDSSSTPVEYFCASSDYFFSVDSIQADESSFLRDVANEGDYIIIYHPDFKQTAENLASLRSTSFPDTNIVNPRVFLADILEIYDEFSGGYLDPYAIKKFVQHAFETWPAPAPSYLVLIGDMSYDYRRIYTTNRKNYIPSIPVHTYRYGQAASDNAFVAVTGTDVMPDLALGRLSIENNVEGAILIDKLSQYPGDNSKKWRNNVLLVGSGVSDIDESLFNFNDGSLYLKNTFLEGTGYGWEQIFRYPNKPAHMAYYGDVLDMRRIINDGVTLINYYGHGGGYQWDNTFSNEDIYLLQNENRQPLALSVTCYTAHFDNQDVFGEQFIKVPNKGCIGFFGSAGLTNWDIGKYINSLIFDEVFKKKNYVSGRFFQNAKARTPYYLNNFADQVSLLTYLGDPALKLALPSESDYAVKSNYITLSQMNPVVGDTVTVNIKMENFGILTESDSITVELYFSSNDTSGIVGEKRIPVFGYADSTKFLWAPDKGGLYNLTAKVNMVSQIPEPDYSDNVASASFAVFSLSEPSIIKPTDGFTTSANSVEFVIADIGSYIGKQLEYHIEIDTSLDFNQPIVNVTIQPEEEIIKYQTQALNPGSYFWRARIYDGDNLGKWSPLQTFRVGTVDRDGFYVDGEQLLLLERNNLNYSSLEQSLYLNTELLPPKPSQGKFIEDITFDTLLQNVDYTVITTDGKYIYIANAAYFVYFVDSTGKSKIYKFGTGYQNTIKGKYYGEVPNFNHQVRNAMFYHSDGYIYVSFGDPYKLLRVDPNLAVNNIDTVSVTDGLIRWNDSRVMTGDYYMASDSNYVYNLAFVDTLGRRRFTLRVFDPANNWQMLNEHYYPHVESYTGVSSFMVIDGSFYPFDYYNSGYFKRVNIQDGSYDDEWLAWDAIGYSAILRFYSWVYDWNNNVVYATNTRAVDSLKKKVTTFVGKYLQAFGGVKTPSIGMANKWKSIYYDVENTTLSGSYSVNIEGLNRETKMWDTLAQNVPSNFDLGSVNTEQHKYCRVGIVITDSSFSNFNPIKIKSIGIDYEKPAELVLFKKNLTFDPDSLLQGLPITMTHKIMNIGNSTADSVLLKYYLNEQDTAFYQSYFTIPGDSFVIDSRLMPTNSLIFDNAVSTILEYKGNEYFTFNNITDNSFFVARDSINPTFYITFDGKEIVNGDIVPNKPEIRITLKDNSPLQLDTSLFTIILDNIPLGFAKNNIQFSYTPYPNSEASLLLLPELKEGRHILDVLAKDSSGNFFDTTFNRSIFYVYDENDIQKIYNYPNPFENYTHFTFELHGNEKPSEVKIKIYTIAGRLIKEIQPSYSDYDIGFNRVLWDGKDQDGDDIANGVYLYRVIAKFNDKTKIETQKVVRMR